MMVRRFLGCVAVIVLLGSEYPSAIRVQTDTSPLESELASEVIMGMAVNQVLDSCGFILLHHPNYRWTFGSSELKLNPVSKAPQWSWKTVGGPEVSPVFESQKITYVRNDVREEYHLRKNSIEQKFVFARPREVGGDLVIEGIIESTGELRNDSRGWSWANEAGEITFSPAYAFDAEGKSLPVSMVVKASSVRYEIEAEALEEVVFPVTIDPEIGTNDFRISNQGPNGDPSFRALDPAIAFHEGTNRYFVVWEGGAITGDIEIYGQLFDATTWAKIGGAVQISDMGPVGDANFNANDPDVVAGDSEFLVVWHGDQTTNDAFEIYGQRVSTGGSLSGSNFRISDMGTLDTDAAFSAISASVAFNSTDDQYLVAWSGDDNSGTLLDDEFEIYIQRLDLNGAELGSDTKISDMGGVDGNAAYGGFNPDVAWNSDDNQYLVIWRGDESISPLVDNEFEIFGQRLVGSTGVQVGTNDFRISDMGTNGLTTFAAVSPSVAYNPDANNYLVVWHGDDDSGGVIDNENEIFGQLLTNLGGETGTNDFRISDIGPDGNANYDAQSAQVAFDTHFNLFLVTWHSDDSSPLTDNEFEIFGQLITAAGAETGTNDFRLSDVGGDGVTAYVANDAALVYNGVQREFMIVWEADDIDVPGIADNEFEIFGQVYAEASTEPAAQPTAPLFSLVTSSSLTVNFTAASGSPEGYLVLRKAGSSPTEIPVDQTPYEVNDLIGGSTVVHVGSLTTFNQSGLTANTQYFYDFFSYNGVNSSINYRTTSPLEASVNTLFAEPSTQGTFSISGFGVNSIQVNLAAGNGSNRLLVVKAGSAVDAFPVDGTSYTPNNNITLAPSLGASNFVVGSGTGLITVSGLTAATVYHFRVFEFNGTALLTNYNTGSITGSTGSQTTLTAEPAAQPTGLNFTSITSSSFTVGFTAASGPPTGYLILRKAGSAPAQPADLPIDGTTYSVSDIIGGSTVVQAGSGISLAQSSLTAATEYFYLVMSFNGSGGNINYRTVTPLAGSQFTLASEPATQASGVVFSSLAPTTLTVSWTNGNGSERLVVGRQAAAVSVNPVDGTTYTGNSDFSIATDLGSGNKVLYRGNGNSVVVSGLSVGTVYHFRVYELNGSATSTNYNVTTASGNPASRTTLSAEPGTQASGLNFSSIGPSSVSVDLVNGNGASRLLVARAGSAVTSTPGDGITYTVNSAFGTPASELGTGNYVVGVGAGPFTVTGLSSGVTYHFSAFEFNGSSGSENYNVTAASGNPANVTTLIVEPTIQATAIQFSALGSGSYTVAWTNGNGNERLVLARAGGAVNVDPVDGASYSGNADFSSATDLGSGNRVVFRGSGSSVTVTGLSAATVYHFRVYELNGSGVSTNYLVPVASGNPSSRTTLSIEPTSQPNGLGFTLQTTSSLTVNFIAASGSPTGYLVIRKPVSASSGVPVDGTTYVAGNDLDGTIVSVGPAVSINETGLAAGTVYNYSVYAFNDSGAAINYLQSTPLSGATITLPDAPVAIAADNVGQNGFTAKWNAVTGASQYRLDVSTDNFSTLLTDYSNTVVLGIIQVVSGLSPGVPYKYRVRAENASGVSVSSNEIEQITVPATPTGLVVSNPTQTTFSLSWDASVGAVDYLLDVSTDNFVTLVSGYDGKVITTLPEVVTGLTVGDTYQVRVRARNGGGTSPNSAEVVQLMKPGTPGVLDASPIGVNSFTAKWQGANGAVSYVLDVSTVNDFSSHLATFPKDVGNVLEFLISGLVANTSYFYQVKAVNATGESPYSTVKPVQTLPDPGGSAIVINPITFSALESGQSAVPITATVTGGSGTLTVSLHHRKITVTDNPVSLPMAVTSGSTYRVELAAGNFDELGAEFFIRATDGSSTVDSEWKYIYRSFTQSSSQPIPTIVRSGGTQQSYQIISVPLALGNNTIAEIFESVLGEYDKISWRLVRHQNGKNADYKGGISLIEGGKSYWFNSVDDVSIRTGAGTTPNYNKVTAFSLSLSSGWNQVATPFPFAIDWDDVLAANGNPTTVSKYKVFRPDPLGFDETNSLQPFSGGFVFADVPIDLTVRVTLKNTAGGRVRDWAEDSNLDAEMWRVGLVLEQGGKRNTMVGFGMHPEALLGKDRWDDITLPRFVDYLEANFYHPEFFAPKFSKDIVPEKDYHEWEFKVETGHHEIVRMSWDNDLIKDSHAALYLVDETAGRMFDMKNNKQVTFPGSEARSFRVIYSREGSYIPSMLSLGDVWPNPADDEVLIPLFVDEGHAGCDVAVDIYDMRGVRVVTLEERNVGAGYHEFVWDRVDVDGVRVSGGMYIVKVGVNGNYLPTSKRLMLK